MHVSDTDVASASRTSGAPAAIVLLEAPPSLFLPRRLNEDLRGFAFEPFDQSIAEEENGLAFIDHRTKTAFVYALNKIETGREPAIYEISGPRCLGRESASFLVEKIEALNGSFTQLMFLQTQAQ